ncbi:CCAAT-binding factor complex subunit Php5 [Schizosaccharomyces cryophilus OY26]|uniref:CCAAT-binding factor complex subunit Php5 n=1 Tax=Schizosaccharomyces cryophilus (strain OY26 / ATCC MYA-4695 / CBS 11777 / NBRC 106824 / NRRL Y48691) TaxID=653667 RepID=S9VR86_SCHCR|nr:CCAAT-binding factor complex subunit Php5 [Schizosaccharomyces cryophilus OY26]EPY50458.1 CCAAT-binding factor complex subunit Php5 [Schizosaccharomyces cryophilus OY26]
MNSIPDSYSLKQDFPDNLGDFVDPSSHPQLRMNYNHPSAATSVPSVPAAPSAPTGSAPDVDPSTVNPYIQSTSLDISSPFDNVTQGLTGGDAEALAEYWQKTIDTLENNDQAIKTLHLPLARIKKVMKTDEEVRNKMISAEAPFLFAKGSEIFVTELTMRAWLHAKKNQRRTLQRSDIANAISKSEMYDFLIDIISKDNLSPAPSMSQPHVINQSAAMPPAPAPAPVPGIPSYPGQPGMPAHSMGYPMGSGGVQHAYPSQIAAANQRAMQYGSHPASGYLPIQEMEQSLMFKQPGMGPDYQQMQMPDASMNMASVNAPRPVMVAPYMAEHLYRYPPTHLESGTSAFRFPSGMRYQQMGPPLQSMQRENMGPPHLHEHPVYAHPSHQSSPPQQYESQPPQQPPQQHQQPQQRFYPQPNPMFYQPHQPQGLHNSNAVPSYPTQPHPMSRYSQQNQ